MLPASELRPGMAVRLEGVLHHVIAAEYHAGGGKMGGAVHAKLRNLDTGTFRERRFRPEEMVETAEPTRQNMQVLYMDADVCYFMHTETFEQVGIARTRLGRVAPYLKEGNVVPVEFYDGQPLHVVFPDIVEMRIVETAPPVHTQGADNVWKEAILDNGVPIQVPPFIAPGELVRVEVASGKYVERARSDRRK